MSKLPAGVRISELTQREVDAHDTLVSLMRKMSKLNLESKRKVYARWEMLHMATEDELVFFHQWLARVTDDEATHQ